MQTSPLSTDGLTDTSDCFLAFVIVNNAATNREGQVISPTECSQLTQIYSRKIIGGSSSDCWALHPVLHSSHTNLNVGLDIWKEKDAVVELLESQSECLWSA